MGGPGDPEVAKSVALRALGSFISYCAGTGWHPRPLWGWVQLKTGSMSSGTINGVGDDEIGPIVNDWRHQLSTADPKLAADLETVGMTLARPTHSGLIGWLITRYVQEVTAIPEKEIDPANPLVFIPAEIDGPLFERALSGIWPWISDEPLRLTLFFPIFGLHPDGPPRNHEISNGWRFRVLGPQEQNEMGRRLAPASEVGYNFSPHRGMPYLPYTALQWLWGCNAAFEYDLTLHLDEKRNIAGGLRQAWPDVDQYTEVMILLGFPGVSIRHIIVPSFPYPLRFSLTDDGNRLESIGLGFLPRLPKWALEGEFRSPSPLTLEVDDLAMNFMARYLRWRDGMPSDAQQKTTLWKLRRCFERGDVRDRLEDGVVALERILKSGTRGVSRQFRENLGALLAKTAEDSALLSQIGSIIYGLRSNIVHEGGEWSQLQAEAAVITNAQTALNTVKRLCRLVFIRLLRLDGENLVWPTHDELHRQLRRSREGVAPMYTCDPYFDLIYHQVMSRIRLALTIA